MSSCRPWEGSQNGLVQKNFMQDTDQTAASLMSCTFYDVQARTEMSLLGNSGAIIFFLCSCTQPGLWRVVLNHEPQ